MKGGGNCYKYVLRVFNQRSLILAEHFRIHEVKRKKKQLTSVKQAIILFLINLCGFFFFKYLWSQDWRYRSVIKITYEDAIKKSSDRHKKNCGSETLALKNNDV